MARGRGGRGRGGQGNRGRGKRNKGPGKSRKKRVSRKPKNRVSRKPRSISKSTRKKISSDRKKKRLSKITNKSLKSRIKAAGLTKKTETKKKTISAAQKRKQVRQNTKDKISTRKKLTFGAPANATTNTNTNTPKRNKFQQQLRNLRKDIAQKSTKEARFQRRADRLKRQFGLDTGDMRDLRININMDQAMKHYGLDTNRFTKGIYNAIPKSIKNFRRDITLGGKFRSPHKLGVREGYRAPNRGGKTIAANTRQQLAERVARSSHPEFVHSRREAA